MSYIEKKYLDKIYEIFNEKLPKFEDILLELLNKKSLKIADDIAKVCADFNIPLIDKLDPKEYLEFMTVFQSSDPGLLAIVKSILEETMQRIKKAVDQRS